MVGFYNNTTDISFYLKQEVQPFKLSTLIYNLSLKKKMHFFDLKKKIKLSYRIKIKQSKWGMQMQIFGQKVESKARSRIFIVKRRKYILARLQKNIRFDFDDKLKFWDVK